MPIVLPATYAAECRSIDNDRSTFGIEEEGATAVVIISLVKATPTKASEHWSFVVKGEAEIDTARFGDPVVAFDENKKEDVAAYMRYMKEQNAVGY